ncbi:FG-GAP repeat domain-containing protein [Paenibacillus sp. strain BS8-2]
MKNRILAVIVLLVIIVSASSFVSWKSNASSLKVLVLYENGTDTYYDIVQHLNQTLVVDVEIESAAWPVSKGELKRYDAVYPDRSLAASGFTEADKLAKLLESYTEQGGTVFAENAFYTVLPKELIGAQSFVQLEELQGELVYPETNVDTAGLQSVIKQFHGDMAEFYNKKRLDELQLGVGVVPSTSQALAALGDGTALYTLNPYGKGYVFFSSAWMPNAEFITGFDMEPRTGEDEPYFNFMMATSSYQLRNEFLSFLSKEKLGYVVTKVLGTNGRPAMAWQNHFEAVASIKDQGMEKWIDYLKEYDQIPSFSLVRETYDWGVWKEGLAYYPNIGSQAAPLFEGEKADSQYSSGNIVRDDSGSAFQMEPYPEYKSLSEELTLPYRAYAEGVDMNGDGVLDLIAGSGSGAIQLYLGSVGADRWMLGKGEVLLLENGLELRQEGFAAPTTGDLNGDGTPDLIVGKASGGLDFYLNIGDSRFRKVESAMLPEDEAEYTAPDVGDLNGDGIPDLVVGGGDGQLMFYAGALEGEQLQFATSGAVLREGSDNKDDRYAAPRIIAVEGGKPGLLVGGNGGFIRRYEAEASADGHVTLTDKGFVEGQTYNPFGDKRLWGGRNSVPVMGDVGGDGIDDLIVGQSIFGYPVAIDDPSFLYREELEQSLAYAKDNHIDIQPHLFFHSYESAEREAEEIELHRKAFEAYGLPWTPSGTNQHTWRVNNLDPTQTIEEQLKAGIWWNSGFRPPSNPYEPSLAGEYLWTMPFLLADKEGVKPFVVANPSPELSIFSKVYDSYAVLDMPITHFYHMEYAILKPESEAGYAKKVKFLDQFRDQNDYNFMTEEQLFRSVMAVYQADSELREPLISRAWNTISNRIRTKQSLSITVGTRGLREMNWSVEPEEQLQTTVASYLPAVGYKVELGSKYRGYVPVVDAPIQMYKEEALYFGGDSQFRIELATAYPESARIERVNVPADVQQDGSSVKVHLNGPGMQQVKIYAPNGITVHSEGWKLEESAEEHRYTLTRFGDKATLSYSYR